MLVVFVLWMKYFLVYIGNKNYVKMLVRVLISDRYRITQEKFHLMKGYYRNIIISLLLGTGIFLVLLVYFGVYNL